MYAETVICKLYEARTDLGLTQRDCEKKSVNKILL